MHLFRMHRYLQFLRPYTSASSRPISRTSQAAYARFFSAAAIRHGPKPGIALETAPAPAPAPREADFAERVRELGLPIKNLYPRITPCDMRMDVQAFNKTFGPLKMSEFPRHVEGIVLQGTLNKPKWTLLSSCCQEG